MKNYATWYMFHRQPEMLLMVLELRWFMLMIYDMIRLSFINDCALWSFMLVCSCLLLHIYVCFFVICVLIRCAYIYTPSLASKTWIHTESDIPDLDIHPSLLSQTWTHTKPGRVWYPRLGYKPESVIPDLDTHQSLVSQTWIHTRVWLCFMVIHGGVFMLVAA